MAYVVATETTLSDGAANSIDVSIPAGHQTDDLIVLIVTQDGGGTTISTPTGFTIINTQAVSQGQRTACFYKVATSSSEPDISMTGATDDWIVCAVLVRGIDTTTPINGSDRTDSVDSTSNSLTSGTVTTTEDNCLVLVAFGFDGVAKLINSNPSSTINLSKEINAGCVQIVEYFNHLSAGATPAITALSEVQSEGGSAWQIAINDANPSAAQMGPFVAQNYSIIKRYGGITTAATNVAAFIRHDAVTFTDASTGIVPTSIDGRSVIAVPTFTQVAFQNTRASTWGSMTGLSMGGSAVDTSGRWMGVSHTIASTDMSSKIISLEFMMSSVNTNQFGPDGLVLYLEDSSGEWVAYNISRRQRLVAATSYVVFIDVENAPQLDASASPIDFSDIVNVGYLLHKIRTSITALIFRIKNLIVNNPIILVDGCESSPCSSAIFSQVANGHGPYLLGSLQGKGQALCNSAVQFGNGTRKVYFKNSAVSHELPLSPTSAINRRFWQVYNNNPNAGVYLHAGSGDFIDMSASITATDNVQNFVISPSSSLDASYNFAGASIIGWDIYNNSSGIQLNNSSLIRCSGEFIGGGLDSCSVSESRGHFVFSDPSLISDCTFTSPGNGHAIEVLQSGEYTFQGNVFNGYGSNSTSDAAIYNNSSGLLILNLGAGDATPTVLNGPSASTTINAPPITVSATILSDSRVQLYNVTQDTEIDNIFESTTSYSFIITSQATDGDIIRIRVCKLGYEEVEATAVFSSSSIGFVINQQADATYTAYGIDGSLVTKFDPDYIDDDVDLIVGSNFSGAEFYAWWNYNLTTEDGIRYFYGALTSIDEGNIKIDSTVLNLKFDNTTTTNVFQTDNIRIYITDAAYPVENPTTGGGGIDLVWRNQVYVVGGSDPLDSIVEGTLTMRDVQKIQLAVMAGLTEIDAGSPTIVRFKSLNGLVDRVEAEMSGSERVSITLDPS